MRYFNNSVKEEFPNIPFDEIDEEMHDIIYLFNKLGLKTQYCCSGHNRYKPYIMFDTNVKFSMAEEISKLEQIYPRMKVHYWQRSTSIGFLENWMMEFKDINDVIKAVEVLAYFLKIPKGNKED